MGKVFLQKSTVNLLSSVLDTPQYFWDSPDSMQTLYNKVCEYRELEGRVELVNARFEIMQKMMNIWSDYSQVRGHARWFLNVFDMPLICHFRRCRSHTWSGWTSSLCC